MRYRAGHSHPVQSDHRQCQYLTDVPGLVYSESSPSGPAVPARENAVHTIRVVNCKSISNGPYAESQSPSSGPALFNPPSCPQEKPVLNIRITGCIRSIMQLTHQPLAGNPYRALSCPASSRLRSIHFPGHRPEVQAARSVSDNWHLRFFFGVTAP